jgi:hypothetical protein
MGVGAGAGGFTGCTGALAPQPILAVFQVNYLA